MNKNFPENITKEIHLFSTAVVSKISVEKVILFGSWAKNSGHHWSDIDIAVISNHFDSLEHYDRILFLLNIARESGCIKIDPQGFTPQEISENVSEFVNDVVNGFEIFNQQK